MSLSVRYIKQKESLVKRASEWQYEGETAHHRALERGVRKRHTFSERDKTNASLEALTVLYDTRIGLSLSYWAMCWIGGACYSRVGTRARLPALTLGPDSSW